MSEDEDCPEDHAFFNSGNCSCDHEPEQHGWTGCDIDGCECKANWEY